MIGSIENAIETGGGNRTVLFTFSGTIRNHFSKLLVRHVFAEFYGYFLEVLERDESITVDVEQLECILKFLARVTLAHFYHHDVQEFMKINSSRPVFIKLPDELLDFIL